MEQNSVNEGISLALTTLRNEMVSGLYMHYLKK